MHWSCMMLADSSKSGRCPACRYVRRELPAMSAEDDGPKVAAPASWGKVWDMASMEQAVRAGEWPREVADRVRREVESVTVGVRRGEHGGNRPRGSRALPPRTMIPPVGRPTTTTLPSGHVLVTGGVGRRDAAYEPGEEWLGLLYPVVQLPRVRGGVVLGVDEPVGDEIVEDDDSPAETYRPAPTLELEEEEGEYDLGLLFGDAGDPEVELLARPVPVVHTRDTCPWTRQEGPTAGWCNRHG